MKKARFITYKPSQWENNKAKAAMLMGEAFYVAIETRRYGKALNLGLITRDEFCLRITESVDMLTKTSKTQIKTMGDRMSACINGYVSLKRAELLAATPFPPRYKMGSAKTVENTPVAYIGYNGEEVLIPRVPILSHFPDK